jgi:S1-C subfamily serine protease
MSIYHKLLVLVLTIFTTCCATPAKYVHQDNIARMKASTVAFMVQDEEGDFNTYCSGFFVSETEIMTADHCVMASVLINLPRELRMIGMALMEEEDLTGTEMIYTTSGYMRGVNENPKEAFVAKVVAEDRAHDAALLRVRRNNPAHLWLDVSHRMAEVGDQVGMMGAPANVEYSYAAGVVSAIRYNISYPGFNKKGPFVQLNIATNGGNSGGPVINSDTGEVIGMLDFVNTRLDGYGFAIASTSLDNFMVATKKAEKEAKEAKEKELLKDGRLHLSP